MAKDGSVCPASGWWRWPCSSEESQLSFQHVPKCLAGLEPKCLGPTGWSCKICRFMESQARGEFCSHLLWPIMGLTEAKWKTPVLSRVFKWQRMISPENIPIFIIAASKILYIVKPVFLAASFSQHTSSFFFLWNCKVLYLQPSGLSYML